MRRLSLCVSEGTYNDIQTPIRARVLDDLSQKDEASKSYLRRLLRDEDCVRRPGNKVAAARDPTAVCEVDVEKITRTIREFCTRAWGHGGGGTRVIGQDGSDPRLRTPRRYISRCAYEIRLC